MIYALLSPERSIVKIGCSERKDPVKRCEEIEQAGPDRLVLLLLMRGDWFVEKELHRNFTAARVPARQEWFHVTHEIEDWLRAEVGIVTQPFYEWLLTRRDGADPIGNFARAATEAKDFPKSALSFFSVEDHLRARDASLETHTSFEEAWREFLRDEAKRDREDLAMKARAFKRNVTRSSKPPKEPAISVDLSEVTALFEHLLPEALMLRPERARALDTILCFRLEGCGDWTVDCKSDPPICARGRSDGACCFVEVSGGDFAAMFSDPNVGMQLYAQKKLRISGDLSHATKIAEVFDLARPEIGTTLRRVPA